MRWHIVNIHSFEFIILQYEKKRQYQRIRDAYGFEVVMAYGTLVERKKLYTVVGAERSLQRSRSYVLRDQQSFHFSGVHWRCAIVKCISLNLNFLVSFPKTLLFSNFLQENHMPIPKNKYPK